MRTLIWIFILAPVVTWAQLTRPQVDYINEQILFLNESVHGLLVAHRIYEGYNQSINKYVDLPSFQINRYSNKDLPKNIFEDPEKWFYDRSPKSIYRELLVDKRRTKLPFNNWPLIAQTNTRTEFVNNNREKIDEIISQENIHQVANVQTIYQELEHAIEHYDKVSAYIAEFEKDLFQYYMTIELPADQKQVYTALIELHYDIKKIIRQIRVDNQSGVLVTLSKIEKETNWVTACINKLSNNTQRQKLIIVRDLISQLKNDIKEYLNGASLPEEYAVFGKGYYYHNVKLLTQINRYGNGYVAKLNGFIREAKWPALHLVEEPHFLKIVYPKRIDVETLMNKDVDPQLDIKNLVTPPLPNLGQIVVEKSVEKEALDTPPDTISTLSEPIAEKAPPKITSIHSITVDSSSFILELYDHKRKDGDRVSINVNGEWLFSNISLEKKPQKLKLSVHSGGQNFIMIRAENIGWMPPNTIGVKYISKSGRVENVFLQADLGENEILQINYQQG